MTQAETAVDRLAESPVLARANEYETFIHEIEPLLSSVERELTIQSGVINVLFASTPTAAAVARALDETDRQARRVVAGFERHVRPENLRGRGVRLVPRRHGLQVARADPGSLDLVLALGGLYQAVTSQPLSFALNLAALLDYGRAALRATGAQRSRPTREIIVRLPVLPVTDHEEYWPGPVAPPASGTHAEELPQTPETAQVQIPSEYSNVRIKMTSADGSAIDIDCSR